MGDKIQRGEKENESLSLNSKLDILKIISKKYRIDLEKKPFKRKLSPIERNLFESGFFMGVKAILFLNKKWKTKKQTKSSLTKFKKEMELYTL